jgi:hypothetical protein
MVVDDDGSKWLRPVKVREYYVDLALLMVLAIMIWSRWRRKHGRRRAAVLHRGQLKIQALALS